MEFTLFALMVALGWKIVDFVGQLRDKDYKSVTTQLTAWAAGVGIVFLGSASDWAAQQDVNGVLLSDINSASKVLVGMALLSVAGVVKDVVAPSED